MNKTVKNPRQPVMGRPMKKIKKGTMPRLLKTLFSFYKAPFIIVLVCVCLSALAAASPSIFQRYVIDTASEAIDAITKGTTTADAMATFFRPISIAIIILASIYMINK